MAFVVLSEKKSCVTPTKDKDQAPAPGQYFQETFKSEKGYAPFLSTVERGIDKNPKGTLPGPGSYDPKLAILNSLKPNKTFHATLSPNKSQVDIANLSTSFKSKTKRFEYKIDCEQPGPGTYYKDPGFGKAASTTSLHLQTCAEIAGRRFTREERTAIPSIPSYSHNYGYTENENHQLVLNKNPLIEIRQFVGPGYYDTKDAWRQESDKGTAWSRSTTKRFGSKNLKLQKANVGPGSYEVSKLDPGSPKYKSKPSSSFASSTQREFIGKGNGKSDSKKLNSTTAGTGSRFALEMDSNKFSSTIVEKKVEENDNGDSSIPGPGRYHNETWASSLKNSYKPTRLQFFGSSSQRFKDVTQSSQLLGPGEYGSQKEKEANRKLKALLSPVKKNEEKHLFPFNSTENRFIQTKMPAIGPGIYEPKTTLVDRVNDKARRGYLGSFGSTEIRFEPLKVEEVKKRKRNTRANQVYSSATGTHQKKPSHYFRSKTEKSAIGHRAGESPPPGTYDVNYYDISKKIKESDSYFATAKKVPFNTSETRFKGLEDTPPLEIRTREEDLWINQKDDSKKQPVVRSMIKLKPSSVFLSKSTKAQSHYPRNGSPGPGTYQPQNEWVKKTFNIKYIEDEE